MDTFHFSCWMIRHFWSNSGRLKGKGKEIRRRDHPSFQIQDIHSSKQLAPVEVKEKHGLQP